MINEGINLLEKYCDGKRNIDKVEISVLQLRRIIKALEQQTCKDAISRQAVLKSFFDDNTEYTGSEVCSMVRNLPSVKSQYTEAEIQKMQELEQAEIQKAYELGKTEGQKSEDAISRQAVLGLFAQNADAVRPYSKTWEEVKALPSVNPQRTGHWIYFKAVNTSEIIWSECSECKDGEIGCAKRMKYCPNCGAKIVDKEINNG